MDTVQTETMPSAFSGRIQVRQELFFWITAGVLLFIFLDTSNLREAEAFRAETFREMLLTGNWFQALFNWNNIYEHSFFSYWLAAPFVKLFGFTEFAFRLPGVLGALAALYGLRMAGKELFNEKVAFLGSWMLLGSAGFLLWGRSGCAEIIGMAAAICSIGWYLRTESSNGFFSWLIFYIIVFAGVFCSGLSALLVPAAVVPLLCLRSRSVTKRSVWKNGAAFLLTLGIFFALLHLPLVFSQVSLKEGEAEKGILDFFLLPWFQEMGAQTVKFSWREYVSNFLLYLPVALLPWSFLLLAGGAGLLIRWRKLPEKVKLTLIGSGIAVLLCPLTCMENSLLAAAPLVMLLGCGGVAGETEEKWISVTVSGAYYIALTVASAAICSIVFYPLWQKLTLFAPSASLMLWPVAAGGVAWFALFLDHRKNNILTVLTGFPHRLGSTVLAGTILTGCCMSVLQPVIHAEFGCGKKIFRNLQETALRELPAFSPEFIIFYRTRVSGGYLFYNRLFSPVSSTGSIREIMERFSGSRVLFVVKDDKALLDEFRKECRNLNINAAPLSLGSVPSPCCGGEVHYSVFTADLSSGGKNVVPDKENMK